MTDDASLRADDALVGSGSRDPAAKRDAMRGMIEEIKTGVRLWRPRCRFGRVLDPAVLGTPGVVSDRAQDLGECLRFDDLVVIPAAFDHG